MRTEDLGGRREEEYKERRKRESSMHKNMHTRQKTTTELIIFINLCKHKNIY